MDDPALFQLAPLSTPTTQQMAIQALDCFMSIGTSQVCILRGDDVGEGGKKKQTYQRSDD